MSLDPRSERSRRRLFDAALALAATGEIDTATVTDVARAAQVTRDTFYRHARSVPELVELALGEKLDELGRDFVAAIEVRARGGDSFDPQDFAGAAEKALLRHVLDYESAYRGALNSDSGGGIRALLTGYVQRAVWEALQKYPEAIDLPGARADDRTIRMIAAYGASGTIGAIHAWLNSGRTDDIDHAVSVILAASPPWWRVIAERLAVADHGEQRER